MNEKSRQLLLAQAAATTSTGVEFYKAGAFADALLHYQAAAGILAVIADDSRSHRCMIELLRTHSLLGRMWLVKRDFARAIVSLEAEYVNSLRLYGDGKIGMLESCAALSEAHLLAGNHERARAMAVKGVGIGQSVQGFQSAEYARCLYWLYRCQVTLGLSDEAGATYEQYHVMCAEIGEVPVGSSPLSLLRRLSALA